MSLVPKTDIEPAPYDSWTERFRIWNREHPSAGVHTGIFQAIGKGQFVSRWREERNGELTFSFSLYPGRREALREVG